MAVYCSVNQNFESCCGRSRYCCGRSPDRATCLHESGGHGQETGPSQMKRETGPSNIKTNLTEHYQYREKRRVAT